MTTIAELGRQLGGVIGVMHTCINRGMLPSTLAEYERTMHHGYCLGLPEEQVTEVYETWRNWYSERGSNTNWNVIRQAMVERAVGQPWRPPVFH